MADYFLHLDGIPGDCQEPGYQGQIAVVNWSWKQESHEQDARPGQLPPLEPQPLVVSKRIDKATPKLMLACSRREILSFATLTCLRSGEARSLLLRVAMSEVRVTDYQITAPPPDNEPTEIVGISFERVEFETTELRPFDGSIVGMIRAGWNLKADQPL